VSIDDNREPVSKATRERETHLEKQEEEMVLTDEGMEIDESDEHPKKAAWSIRESLEPDSNVTVQSDSHPRKQFWQRL
jgi:hypothetical protein